MDARQCEALDGGMTKNQCKISWGYLRVYTLSMSKHPLLIFPLKSEAYTASWLAMRAFTEQRSASTPDELWFIEHPPVFTQGQAGKAEHILAPGNIPIVQSDRGGQVTYHGPGQLLAYLMMNLKSLNLTVRDMVCALQRAVIELLKEYEINGEILEGAPGVYIKGAKIAAMGLRVKRGYTYHGLSLNIDMDLEPFSRINPCGYQNLRVTQLKDWGGPTDLQMVSLHLSRHLQEQLGYTEALHNR